MPPKKQQGNTTMSSHKYNLRQNKKDKQVSKNNARSKKSYGEDQIDLPEGVYDSSEYKPEKVILKKNIVEFHSPSNSPPDSDEDGDIIAAIVNSTSDDEYEIEEQKFDDSYFEPVEYCEPAKPKENR